MKKYSHIAHIGLFIVAALGYYIDTYDIVIFNVVKKESLLSIGVNIKDPVALFATAKYILNYTMIGFVLGGIFWGIWGDFKGRIYSLFLTIFIYSLSMFLTIWIKTVDQYAWLRLIAGFGLAGELGLGITIICEFFSARYRMLLSALVSASGALGAFSAFWITQLFTSWKIAYLCGSILGISMLIFRLFLHQSSSDSVIFEKIVKTNQVVRGNILMLFNKWKRFRYFISSLLIPLTFWFLIVGVATFADRFLPPTLSTHVNTEMTPALFNLGLCVGDIVTAFISNMFKSRKKAIALYFILQIIIFFLFFNPHSNYSVATLYTYIILLGFTSGYWTLFHIIVSEQFGTNLRSTATVFASSLARAGLIPLLLLVSILHKQYSYPTSIIILLCILIPLAFIGLFSIKETYNANLDFVES